MQTNLKSFLISLYIWTFIVITMLPLFVIFFILWILVYPFDRKNMVTHYFTFLWTRLYLTINPGWKIRVENRNRIQRGAKYILISNHQSIIDIALLLQIRINFKWVSKIELAGVPFVGWVMWLNDHIMVRRGDKNSVIQMAGACRKVLNGGTSIFLFPEGTRTGNGELQPFKEGAFILAKDNGVPILPVVLDGASKALPNKGFWFCINQTFTVRVLNEITSEVVNRMEIPQLAAYARNLMAEELVKIRDPKIQ
jgi:1-acyl-sn-glycerol-3-phosphate acyltransferase